MIEECKHGMHPDWCANCQEMLTPEEEEQREYAELDDLVERLHYGGNADS